MTASQLLFATIVLPGLWGWIVGFCGHKWWKPSERASTAPVAAAFRRPTDYEI